MIQDMLSLRCQSYTHIIYNSLQSRLCGWDTNHTRVSGITLAFKTMEILELLGKKEKRLQASGRGKASEGWRRNQTGCWSFWSLGREAFLPTLASLTFPECQRADVEQC